ncbi:MAG: tRNA (N(6)-L-threonylcarbamoyladenosine(37)-C(2))-methylthiotransferase MtaB [Flavobacteriia bacterium]|nr:tRNA (N(6)-L-threonylcarbamoyladenosine(37)-C(2))-methylthiotransferase MtaB [Flavobacteriia bacterium]
MQFQRKVAVYTLGCKLNFSESSTLARSFEEAGYARVDFEDAPDVFVINTCSVTENADKKCKQLVRKAKEINPSGYVAIVGCYAQLKPEEIAKIPGVNMVLGANEKFKLVEEVEANFGLEQQVVKNESIKHALTFHPSFSAGDRTRSFLKIQDGCDYFCTFCTIPLARGKSRNASIAETLSQAKKLVDSPVREVVLTGVNIGDFGQGGDETFFQLIQALDTLEGIDRFRISSIEPNLLSNEIIDFCLKRSQRFMPHFHIPLQSGSDRILKLMRRKYDRTLFQNRVEHIKSVNPDCCIGVDVIVGFPGESDEDFRETMDFLQSLDVSYLHVFTYSERANTTAVKLGDPVPMHVRKDRSKQLHWLSDRKKQQFYHSQLGKHLTVLFEQEEDEGKMYGFTENYLKVERPFDASLVNQLVPVCVDQMTLDQTVKVTLDPL